MPACGGRRGDRNDRLGGVEVLVESERDDGVAGGGFSPLGMTIGVDWRRHHCCRRSPPSLSESSCGGQSTDVGGQLSVFPDPDDESGGAQPEPAPKSPGLVQSALATPTGRTAPTRRARRPPPRSGTGRCSQRQDVPVGVDTVVGLVRVDHRRGEEPDGHLSTAPVHLDVCIVDDDLTGAALERLLSQPQVRDGPGQQVDRNIPVDIGVRADDVE